MHNNPNLLLIHTSLNFKINHPIHWHTLDTTFKKQLINSILVNDYKQASLLKGYMNSKDTSLMLLLNITKIDTSVFNRMKSEYKTILNKKNIWDNVQFHEFKHNCFKIEQYVMQNTQMVQFKLICYDYNGSISPKLELNFFMNRKNNQNIKSIESSIGSLKCLIKNQ